MIMLAQGAQNILYNSPIDCTTSHTNHRDIKIMWRASMLCTSMNNLLAYQLYLNAMEIIFVDKPKSTLHFEVCICVKLHSLQMLQDIFFFSNRILISIRPTMFRFLFFKKKHTSSCFVLGYLSYHN